MGFYFISVFMLLFGGIISTLVKEKHKMKICAVFAGIGMILSSIPSLFSLFTGNILVQSVDFLPLFDEINFVLDPLSSFFVLLISVMSFVGILYANGYIKHYLNKKMYTSSHTLFLMLLVASMSLVVTVQNSLFFLVVWEIMSLSSFFLVIFEGDKKEVINAGIKYLIYMHLSVIFIIAVFAILNIYTESYNFADFTSLLNQNKHLANIVFILSFIGFGTKAGFMPFHNWLPDAHPASPVHISGIMSGIMIKTGIYGILRILFLIEIPTRFIAYCFLIVSILSALWGVLYAISQHDIKKLLAYHSIENIGIIGIGIGTGLVGMVFSNPYVALFGFLGAILHVLNHSIFKMLLFFASGNIYTKAHTRNVELMGGLIKSMPYTSLLFIIGSIAICGLPLFNGFISEFLIYIGMIFGLKNVNMATFVILVISIGALALIGTMAILCFTKVSGVMLLGNPRSVQVENVKEDVEKIMLIPMGFLAILTLLIGIFPQYAIELVITPAADLIHNMQITEAVGNLIYYTELISKLFFVFLTIFLIVLISKFLLNKKSEKHSTWGCGYNKPNNRMQYSASSYANPFISTLKPLFKRISHIKKPKDLFPKEAYYEIEIEDIEEAYIVKPLIKLDEKILSKFERIQNGNIQQYILFGLVFLIVAIIGAIYIG